MIPPDNAELAKMIAAVGRGDSLAFKRLYSLMAPKLLGLVLRILHDRAMAEDVVHDVFIRVWQNAANFSPERGPAWPWLIAIARNRAIDLVRQKSTARGASEKNAADPYENPTSGDSETAVTDLETLRHCLGKIPEPARSCVILAYYEGFSREELAARFERPVSTIKTWLRRSLVALRACLETGT